MRFFELLSKLHTIRRAFAPSKWTLDGSFAAVTVVFHVNIRRQTLRDMRIGHLCVLYQIKLLYGLAKAHRFIIDAFRMWKTVNGYTWNPQLWLSIRHPYFFLLGGMEICFGSICMTMMFHPSVKTLSVKKKFCHFHTPLTITTKIIDRSLQQFSNAKYRRV